MKNFCVKRLKKHFSSISSVFALLSVFFVFSCSSEQSDIQRFDRNLQGVWYSNDESVYYGGLIIDYNRITILDYAEIQTPPLGDDTRRPFRDFTKGTPLTGYTEDDIMFIRDAGEWHEVKYVYYVENSGRDRFLRFTFGGRIETLRLEH